MRDTGPDASKQAINIAIVGGGIGGLTTALALQRLGIAAHVYEQKREFSEVGLGLGLDTNSLRLLHRLGLTRQLDEIGFPHTAVEYRWGPDGRLLQESEIEVERDVRALNVHRGQFLRVLQKALPAEQLHSGKPCVGIDNTRAKARVSFADGTSIDADAVIGADGIRSFVRSLRFADVTRFSGRVVYRGLVESAHLPESSTAPERMIFWLGPRQHILTYPISGGSIVNIAAFVETDSSWTDSSWVVPTADGEVAQEFDGWDISVERMVTNLDDSTRWGLFDCEPLPAWSEGRVTLLGDAAHAMLPHHGQGASQAIEDAVVIAACLANAEPSTVEEWLGRYEEIRKPRAERVQQLSREMGQSYSTSEDAESQLGLVNAGLEDDQWLWDHDVERTLAEALDGA